MTFDQNGHRNAHQNASGSESVIEKVRRLAGEAAAREGCELYDAELVGAGAGRVLRVYIDREGGASIEDCSNVSRGLNLVLDVEDPIPGGQYHLEVSTPGLERSLRLPWHFERAVGQTVSAKSFAPLMDFNPERPELAKAKQITGRLASVDKDGVRIEWQALGPKAAADGASDAPDAAPDAADGAASDVQTPTVYVPFASLTKAHVVFKFDEGSARPAGAPHFKKQSSKKKEKRKK